ncbi:MAG: formimidoylglutamate deiminase [Pyrinomonadaceae bacterium]
MKDSNQTTWLPDLIYADGRFQRDLALVCDGSGPIVRVAPANEVENPTRLNNRAMLPGLINAHSHAFQRVLRGRTEYRTTNPADSFWTWREMMYSAAARLSPEDIYDASRMAFLEMILGGITAVGEFHYIHHNLEGEPYDDPNLLAKEVVRAARDVGLRIALLRVAYARAGFQTDSNPKQARFIERDPETYLRNLEALVGDLGGSSIGREGSSPSEIGGALPDGRASAVAGAWVGVAPHSVRAVPLEYLRQVVAYANEHELPVHMHVAEQMAEVSACIQEYGRSPVALLETEGSLSPYFTAVHAIHVTPKAIATLGRAGATVCACPTTERNLGDGVIPADSYFKEGVSIALGTDSHAQIDLLEDARELEYHLRLQRMERAVLAGAAATDDGTATLAARLFDCATVNGAKSIGAPSGRLEPGRPADFFTVGLDDPSIAGASADDLLASIVFSLGRAAVRDVVVGGKQIVSQGRHHEQEKIVERFSGLQGKLWGAEKDRK